MPENPVNMGFSGILPFGHLARQQPPERYKNRCDTESAVFSVVPAFITVLPPFALPFGNRSSSVNPTVIPAVIPAVYRPNQIEHVLAEVMVSSFSLI